MDGRHRQLNVYRKHLYHFCIVQQKYKFNHLLTSSNSDQQFLTTSNTDEVDQKNNKNILQRGYLVEKADIVVIIKQHILESNHFANLHLNTLKHTFRSFQ